MMLGLCLKITEVSSVTDEVILVFINFFFSEIMKLARVEEESQVSRMTQCEEDHFEMLVRASNIVMSKFYDLKNSS